MEAFDRDFFSKCYLTEQKYANSWIMDIDHFIPQNERPDLVYEWANLFPVNHYANMIKPRKTPAGGYLNPSIEEDDVESDILYSFSSVYGEDPFFEPADAANQKAVNTCKLLDRLHNGHDTNTQKATINLRSVIHKRYKEIQNKIAQWRNVEKGSSEEVKIRIELKRLLSRKASFSMLMRSMVAVKVYLPADFLD